MLFRPLGAGILRSNPQVQVVHEEDFVRACLIAVEKNTGAFTIIGLGALTVDDVAAITGTSLVRLPAIFLYPLLVEVLWRLRFPQIEVNGGHLDYARHSFVASSKKAEIEPGFFPAFSSRQVLEETARHRQYAEPRK